LLSETEPSNCHDCGQLIIKSAQTGRPINFMGGLGGERGEDHICPKRIGSKFHKVGAVRQEDIEPDGITCPVCATNYYRQIFPLCPNCNELKCIECGHRFKWKNGGQSDTCPSCGIGRTELIDISPPRFKV
jgi:hypothetical protein